MAIRISKYYLRFAILALLAVFSCSSYSWDACSGGTSTTEAGTCTTQYGAGYSPFSVVAQPAGYPYVGRGVIFGCQNTSGAATGANALQCHNSVSCPSGQELNLANGACECSGGQELVGGVCTTPQACDSADEATARADLYDGTPETTLATIYAGYNTINASVTDQDICLYTCKVHRHGTVSIGNVIGNQYEVTETVLDTFIGGACESMQEPTTTTTPVNIGYGGEGTGCAAGFVYGSVNGRMGCHYVGTAPGGAGSTPVPGAGQPSAGSGTSSSGTSTTTTTTTNSDGTTSTSTSTTSSSGTATNPVFGNGTDGSGIGCDPTDANYFKCQGLGDFKGDEIDYSDAFDLDAMDTKIEDKKNEIVDAINDFKNQIGDELGISASGALPVYTTTVNGTTLRMDFAQYATQLGIFASVLVFVSLVISAYIILRGS